MDDGKNCRNCGAPLGENGDCEYCGTKSPRICESSIEITGDSIRLYTGSRKVYPPQATNGT